MIRRKFLSVLGALAVAFGLFLLYRVFRNQDPATLRDALVSVTGQTLLMAGLFTTGSFGSICMLEYLAVRHARSRVSVRRIIATAVAAIGIGHSVGLAALSSGAIRYRMYGRAGRDIVFVGKVLLFSAISTAGGFAGIGGIALLWRAETLAPLLGLVPDLVRGVGIGMLAVLALYLIVASLARSRTITLVRTFALQVPSARVAALQLLGANINVFCIAGTLYACLHEFTDATYSIVAALYVSSDVTALVGHVPGGWSVLEYVVTNSLSGSEILAGVVLFRAIYYLVPLLIGLGVFLLDEFISYRRQDSDLPSHKAMTTVT